MLTYKQEAERILSLGGVDARNALTSIADPRVLHVVRRKDRRGIVKTKAEARLRSLADQGISIEDDTGEDGETEQESAKPVEEPKVEEPKPVVEDRSSLGTPLAEITVKPTETETVKAEAPKKKGKKSAAKVVEEPKAEEPPVVAEEPAPKKTAAEQDREEIEARRAKMRGELSKMAAATETAETAETETETATTVETIETAAETPPGPVATTENETPVDASEVNPNAPANQPPPAPTLRRRKGESAEEHAARCGAALGVDLTAPEVVKPRGVRATPVKIPPARVRTPRAPKTPKTDENGAAVEHSRSPRTNAADRVASGVIQVCTKPGCGFSGDSVLDFGTRTVGGKVYKQPQCRGCRAAASKAAAAKQKAA